MGKEKSPSFTLPKVDDLFSTQAMRDEEKLTKIREISTSEIDSFPDHPFKVIENEDMLQLVDSIAERGVITPVILRQKEDERFEMIAGHRRLHASKLAGKETIPSEIRELTRDEAIILMVESNYQRTEILPSEKAFSYKMRLEAIGRRAGRPGLVNGAPVEPHLVKGKSRDIIAEQSGESREQIRRYIRLTELIPEILEMVDDKKIAFRPAVELSYLNDEEQYQLLDNMELNESTPSLAQAIKMKQFSQEGKLSEGVIESIMGEEKPNQKERIVLQGEKVRKLIPKEIPVTKTEEYIISALEHYNRVRQRRAQER